MLTFSCQILISFYEICFSPSTKKEKVICMFVLIGIYIFFKYCVKSNRWNQIVRWICNQTSFINIFPHLGKEERQTHDTFVHDYQIASISPGSERFTRSRGWLCHSVVERTQPIGLNSVTVSQVLKYSLN